MSCALIEGRRAPAQPDPVPRAVPPCSLGSRREVVVVAEQCHAPRESHKHPAVPSHETTFVCGWEQLCASRAGPQALLMWLWRLNSAQDPWHSVWPCGMAPRQGSCPHHQLGWACGLWFCSCSCALTRCREPGHGPSTVLLHSQIQEERKEHFLGPCLSKPASKSPPAAVHGVAKQ